MLKPGERQATPMSWIARPADAIWSRDVSGADGRAADGWPGPGLLEDDNLRRLGRCRPVGKPGDVGSFFTMTLEMCGALDQEMSATVSGVLWVKQESS